MTSDAPRSREEQALAELGHTSFSRGVRWMLVGALLLTILIVPLVQACSELGRFRVPSAAAVEAASPEMLEAEVLPFGRDLRRRVRRLLAWVPTEARLRRFETALERGSVVGHVVRTTAQTIITSRLDVGNDTIYVGEHRWLFDRMGVEYVMGPGFLDPQVLARRRAAAKSTDDLQQPDPRPAIIRFRRQLAARGIDLILLPTPDKAMIHPERFRSVPRWDSVPQNPSYAAFREALARERVEVFDPSADIYARSRTSPAYLRADTHWLPETMGVVAAGLARTIGRTAGLPPRPQAYRTKEAEAHLVQFDLVNLLYLPLGQMLYPPLTLRVRQVVDHAGALWQPTPSADVLLLGDSFCMMYGTDQIGRPLAAGLPETLSVELARPLDKICLPGGGAYLSRLVLANELARGWRRLDGTRVVIWQFAIRDLAWGDWRIVDLPG